jgi:hypothetical protein
MPISPSCVNITASSATDPVSQKATSGSQGLHRAYRAVPAFDSGPQN